MEQFISKARWRTTVRRLGFAWISAVALGVAGCAVGPTYQAPAPNAAAQWHSPLPHGGSAANLADWWAQFDDPALTQLLAWAEAESTSLIQAWARIEKARATLTTDRSGALPNLSASANSTRSRQQLNADQATLSAVSSAGLDASWEIDLFGKLRRNAEAASARIDARIADWHDARVSLAAEVADTYVQYRACQLLAEVYDRELQSQTATQRATASMVEAGLSAPADGALARASVANSRSSALRQRGNCTVLLKSLVYLTGHDEPELITALAASGPAMPSPKGLPVDQVPAQVLRQRPDLASLERELAATSAEIGAAQADRYPSFALSGSIARASTGGNGSSYPTWSFGPQLSLPLFDAGKRQAAVNSAQASYQSALAGYQAGVRLAVKEVEQALVNLDSSVNRSGESRRAAQAYREYFGAAEANWRAGAISLLSLEEARRSALSADIDDINLQQAQISQWIALYKAVGGGWTPDTPATAPPSQGASRPINSSPQPSKNKP
jgi:multidrug efflux system outer membrane protein